MTITPITRNYQEEILTALKAGPKTKGELLDLTGLNYTRLDRELSNLIGAGKVFTRFADSPSTYLLYCSTQPEQSFSLASVFWPFQKQSAPVNH